MTETFYHINIAQSFFAGVILLTKRPVKLTDKILSGWLISLALLFSLQLLLSTFPEQKLSGSSVLAGIIALLFPPTLYLYAKYTALGLTSLTKSDRWHYSAFILLIPILVYSIIWERPFFYQNFLGELSTSVFFITFGIIFFGMYFLYGIYTIRLVNTFQSLENDYYANHHDRIDLKWIKYLSILFYVFWTFIIIIGALRFHFGIDIPKAVHFIPPTHTVIIYIISFKAYRQSYSIIPKEAVEPPKKTNEEHQKYAKSGLRQHEAEQYLITLIEHMETKKPWLEPDLNIKSLALRTEIPQHYITQTLNERLNKNFYTFVNEYRTNEVVRLFSDQNYQHWTIVAIAYECGFNSKSSFNAFFKKYVGETPSSYRKKIKVQSGEITLSSKNYQTT
ncbi:transcriptional regulator (plasmid) [Fulvitalea axinellae]|uniref:Transcriptional regulator n=1 Tax=Fulvitalea axinellae TaxID=1182444 RepID=A0AAU9CU14_9BACT|nr:transcriptional regulator [Fulvitalea axinellae]